MSTEEQAQVKAEVVEKPTAEAEAESTGTQEEDVIKEAQGTGFVGFIKSCFSRNNLKKTIAVILLVLIAGGTASAYFHSRTPEAIALRYAKACLFDDVAEISKVLAYDDKIVRLYGRFENDEESFFEYESDYLQEDIYSWDDYYKAIKERKAEQLEDYFGNYELSCDIKRVKDVSERKIKDDYEDEIAFLESADVLDADMLGQGKIVVVKGKIDSEDEGIARFYNTVVLVKVSSSWKVLTCDYEAELNVME